MRSGSKLAVFAVGLAAAFGAAAAVGAAVGPIDTGDDDGHDDEHATPAAAVTVGDAAEALSGLAVTAGGHRFVAHTTSVAAGAPAPYTFEIEGPDGEAVTAYDEIHERRLHLIVVSRSLVDYAHLHPELAPDGAWSVELPALPAGSYRVYADVKPTGSDQIALATDLLVPGDVASVAAPAPATSAVIDGYEVTMAADPAVGESTITFTVTRDGEEIATEPYLGAAGHLVVIRAGDLGYLHVHPLEARQDAAIPFGVEFPSRGTYRLFLDFAHGDEVHTAAFTVGLDADPEEH